MDFKIGNCSINLVNCEKDVFIKIKSFLQQHSKELQPIFNIDNSITINVNEKENNLEISIIIKILEELFYKTFLPENLWVIPFLLKVIISHQNLSEEHLQAKFNELILNPLKMHNKDSKNNMEIFTMLFCYITQKEYFISSLTNTFFNYNFEKRICYKKYYLNKINLEEIKSINQIIPFLRRYFTYGYRDIDSNYHNSIPNCDDPYFIGSLEEIFKSKVACCLDEARVIQLLLKQFGISSSIKIVRFKDEKISKFHAYTFCTYKEHNYHFERYITKFLKNPKLESNEDDTEYVLSFYKSLACDVEIVEIDEIPSNISYQDLEKQIFGKTRTIPCKDS